MKTRCLTGVSRVSHGCLTGVSRESHALSESRRTALQPRVLCFRSDLPTGNARTDDTWVAPSGAAGRLSSPKYFVLNARTDDTWVAPPDGSPAVSTLFSLRPGNGESTAGRHLGGAAGRLFSRKYFVLAQTCQRGMHGRTTLGWCRRIALQPQVLCFRSDLATGRARPDDIWVVPPDDTCRASCFQRGY
jgi:hypothetical protein